MSLRRGVVLALAATAALAGAACAPADDPAGQVTTAPGEAPARWTYVASDLRLGSAGIGFELHPSRRGPIVVQASAQEPLEVCPAKAGAGPAAPAADSSWGRRWSGGCRPLGDEPSTSTDVALPALPATNGSVHVSIRVRPARGGTGPRLRVEALRLRWGCVDEHLFVARGAADPVVATPDPSCRRLA